MAPSTNFALRLVRPSILSISKMSILMLTLMASFQKSAAVATRSATGVITTHQKLPRGGTPLLGEHFYQNDDRLLKSKVTLAPVVESTGELAGPIRSLREKATPALAGVAPARTEKAVGASIAATETPDNSLRDLAIKDFNWFERDAKDFDWFERGGGRLMGGGTNVFEGGLVALSADGTTIALGASGSNSEILVYKYDCENLKLVQLGQNLAADAHRVSIHGIEISADGMTIAVGLSFSQNNVDYEGYVRAYLYKNDEDRWNPLGQDIGVSEEDYRSRYATSTDFPASKSFALSSDASTIALHDGEAWRVYAYDGTKWTQLGEALGSGLDSLSYIAALSSDGNTVAVVNRGSVTVYKFRPLRSGWQQLGQSLGDDFGSPADNADAVDMSSDGMTIAIGASDAGRVRVYAFSSTSAAWLQVGEDIDGENFGKSVAMSHTGTVVVIGAPNYASLAGSSNGTVWVYAYDRDSSNWIQYGEAVGGASGTNVAMAGDGKTIAFGSRVSSSNGYHIGQANAYHYVSGPYQGCPVASSSRAATPILLSWSIVSCCLVVVFWL